MAKLTIIRFDLNRPDGYDVNRLPEGVKGNPQLMMWKELCRSGIYETGGVKHNIDREFLQNIVDTFWERNAKGIEVPCPVGHTHDPEAKRGRVVYVELREGRDGQIHLYGIIEFVDFNAKKTLCNSGVSIEAPEVVTDGDGETHKYGLEHVAFTDYPVVAGMDGFRDVVFSIFQTKDRRMGRKRRFSDELDFETCPNCGHEFDDVDIDEDIVQSRRYGRRFDDDIIDEDIDVIQSRRYGRRFDDDLAYDEDAEFDDDIAYDDDIIQGRRYGRRCSRFADDTEFDDDLAYDEDTEFDDLEDVTQSRRYGRRCSRRFADDVIYDDDIAYDDDVLYDDDLEDDVVQSRYGRRCSRFDDEPIDDSISQSRRYGRRYGRRFADDELLDEDLEDDVVQGRCYGRRYGRRFADDLAYDDDAIMGDEDILESRYARRCSRFDDLVDLDEDVDIVQGRRFGKRFASPDYRYKLFDFREYKGPRDVANVYKCAKIEKGRRGWIAFPTMYDYQKWKEAGSVLFDDDGELDDVVQSRYSRRFDDIIEEDETEEFEGDNILTDVVESKFGKKFADEVQYDEMPASEDDEPKNALAAAQDKMYGDKKFSMGDADTVSANILKENRELQVQQLLSTGKINRIQAKQILDRFCNQTAISFSVQSGDNSEFRNIIDLMKSGIGADYSEKTGVQFALPADNGNELIAEIERRAAERKG